MSTCVRHQLPQQGPEYDVAMLQITGLAGQQASGDSKVNKSIQDSSTFTKSPTHLLKAKNQHFSKVAVSSHPRLKMASIHLWHCNSLLGIPKRANALNMTPNDGTIPETTPNKPWHLALRLRTASSSSRLSCSSKMRNTATGVSYPSHPSHSRHCYRSQGTMQELLIFFTGLDGVTGVGRLKGVMTGRQGRSQKP